MLYLFSFFCIIDFVLSSAMNLYVYDYPKILDNVIFLYFDILTFFCSISPGIEYVRVLPRCFGYFYFVKKREFDLLMKTALSAQWQNHML